MGSERFTSLTILPLIDLIDVKTPLIYSLALAFMGLLHDLEFLCELFSEIVMSLTYLALTELIDLWNGQ